MAYAADGEGQLYAGTAKVDVTPPVGIIMCGYGDTAATGIHDPLYVRVLVLKDGDTTFAFVSADLVYLWSKRIISEAKEKWGMDHVLLCASHTHAGPTYLMTDWYPTMEDKVIAAIGEAASNMFPARIGAGEGPVDSNYFSYNRRFVKKGNVEMVWSNLSRRANGPTDQTVRVIRIDDDAGQTRAMMIHYAAHPVTLGSDNSLMSADFPGPMAAYVEKALGNNAVAMFIQGAGGDTHPFKSTMRGDAAGFKAVEENGVSLGKSALTVAKNIEMAEGPASIKVKESVLTMGHRQDAKTDEVGVMAVLINNDIAMGTVTFEPFVEHQLNLVARSPVKNTWFVGYSFFGEGITVDTYLPTIQATKDGGYGAAVGSYNIFEVGAGEKMVDEAVKSICEMSGMPARIVPKTSGKSARVPSRPPSTVPPGPRRPGATR